MHFRPITDLKRGEESLPVALAREEADGSLDLELAAKRGAFEPLARGQELSLRGESWIVLRARLSADQSYTWASLITPAAWAALQPKPELESGAQASDAAGAASEAAPQTPPRNRRARASSTAPTESLDHGESSEPPRGEEQQADS